MQVTVDDQGRLNLPEATRKRQSESAGNSYWLEEREGDLVLHSRVPDTHKLYLEPTTGCNLNCRTCIRNVWQDPAAIMSMTTFGQVLASLDGLPDLKRVVFTGFGEPLIHPHILDMIAAIRTRGLAVTVGSNGLRLDAKMARELVQLGVDRLVISVDGIKPETYADIRGTVLANVLDNIRTLSEAKRELGSLYPALGIEFVAIESNVDELAELSNFASKLGAARVLVSNVLPYTEEMYKQMLYGYGPRPPMTSHSWPVDLKDWIMWGTLELPRMHWGAERRYRFVRERSTMVGWDGGIAPCYALSHNYSSYAVDGRKKRVSRYLLGNVNTQGLADVWMSEDYVRFRSEVRDYHFPSCPDCDLRESCDLRERNEACWGWNPSCADCLWAQDIVRCP